MTLNPKFDFRDYSLSRVWHCFGNYMHKVDIKDVLSMLEASKTNVVPINTHNMNDNNGRDGLVIGFGGVKFDDLSKKIKPSDTLLMLNINHQITAEAAVNKTLRAVSLTNEKLIKLEVLNKDMASSNNDEIIKAVEKLRALNPSLVLMPLLQCNYLDAKRLVELGCPLLRVMGSNIGAGAGILDKEEFKKICSLNVPVVLDGGVGKAEDFFEAIKLGAIGCLVNSMLFKVNSNPTAELKKFMQEIQPVFNNTLSLSAA